VWCRASRLLIGPSHDGALLGRRRPRPARAGDVDAPETTVGISSKCRWYDVRRILVQLLPHALSPNTFPYRTSLAFIIDHQKHHGQFTVPARLGLGFAASVILFFFFFSASSSSSSLLLPPDHPSPAEFDRGCASLQDHGILY